MLQRLGIGGMAEVFRAKALGAEGFEKDIAIKVILPRLLEDPEFQKMFVDEAKLATHLRHPNIVQVLDLGRVDDRYYIAMELIEGHDLHRVISVLHRREKRLPIALSLWIAMEVLRALEHAHTAKGPDGVPLAIVHRDVSPQNVLLSLNGEVKLSDFGIARSAIRTHAQTDVGFVRGKLPFLSPEQVDRGAVGPWSDVFATGLVLLTMLSGEHPLKGKRDGELLTSLRNGDLPRPSALDATIPPGLDAIVSRALAPRIVDRHASAGAFLEELEEYVHRYALRVGARPLAAFLAEAMQAPPAAAAADIDLGPMSGSLPTIFTPAPPLHVDPPPVTAATPAPIPMTPSGAPAAQPVAARRAASIARFAGIAIATVLAAAGTGVMAHDAGRARAERSAAGDLLPASGRTGAERPATAAVGWLDFDPWPWADCTLDGLVLDPTPLVGIPLQPGPHELVCRTPDGRQGRIDASVEAGRSIRREL